MFKPVKFIFTFVLLLFFSSQIFAAKVPSKINSGVNKIKNALKGDGKPVKDSNYGLPEVAPKKKISFPLSYSGTTDFADDSSPRLYNHRINGGVNYVLDKYRLSAGLGFRYVSHGSEIQNGEFDSEFTDINFGVRFPVWKYEKLVLLNSTRFYLPTGENSRLQGYRGLLSSSMSAIWAVGKKFSIVNGYGLSYLSNRYKTKRGGNTAFDWSSRFGINGIYNVNKYFSLSAGAGLSSNRAMEDNTWDVNFSNSLSASFRYKKGSLGLSYSNSTYPDENTSPIFSLFVIDDFRNIVSMNASYLF